MEQIKGNFEIIFEIGLNLAISLEAKKRYGRSFWTGTDGVSVNDTVIHPNIPTQVEGEGTYYWDIDRGLNAADPATSVLVHLEPDSIPRLRSFRFLPDRYELPTSQQHLFDIEELGYNLLLTTSTKSRLAQLGIQVSDEQDIPTNIWRNLAAGHPVDVPFQVNNYSAREIILNQGTPLFRFASPLLSEKLAGDQLLQAYKRGLIEIDGKMGETWEWVGDNPDDPQGEKNPKTIYGIRVKVKPGTRWLPPSQTPLSIRDFLGTGYREKIDALLEPVPDTDQLLLCISETHPIHLSSQITGLISTVASGFGRQINSRVIDPGSQWGIRVEEIISPQEAKYRPRYMEICFYQSDKTE